MVDDVYDRWLESSYEIDIIGTPIGLLLNFNVALLKDGIVRKINTPRADDEPIVGFA